MSAVQTWPAGTVPEAVPATGVTLRPPRLMLVDQHAAGTLQEPVDPVRVREMLRDGVLHRPQTPCTAVYQVSDGRHQQTGVVAEVAVDDYRDGLIRRHEATQPERERRLAEFTESTGIEQGPVTLTHQARPELRRLLAEAATGEPDVRVTLTDGLTHTVWLVHDHDQVAAIQRELGGIEALYIADGHHRMASAERYASGRGHLGAEHPAAFTLGALFPSDEMRILGYPRCVARPADRPATTLLSEIAALPVVARVEEFTPPESARPGRGIVAMYLDGRWHRLWLRPQAGGTSRDAVRDHLDVVALDEQVIAPVFGADAAHMPLPGATNATRMARWCSEHASIGFLPSPPRVEQVMSVSDAGLIMPPKSTWFTPKATSGLFLRELA